MGSTFASAIFETFSWKAPSGGLTADRLAQMRQAGRRASEAA